MKKLDFTCLASSAHGRLIMPILCFIFVFGFLSTQIKAQNCTSMYVITAKDGKVYSIDLTNGNETLITTIAGGKNNLAVGPDPSNTSATVFTSSNDASGSTIYNGTTSTGTTLPTNLSGFGTNPATTGATAGYTYGISSTRQLVQVRPTPTTLGTITGDATWTGATVGGDVFFNNTGKMLTIVKNGSSSYLYEIDIATLVATQNVQLSGTLPTLYQGIAYLNGKIYAAEITYTSLIIVKTYYVQFYEINPNTGQSTKIVKTSSGSSSNFNDIDLATCEAFVPSVAAGGPTCNELFGVVGGTQDVYRINLSTMGTTVVTTGNQTNQGNMAFGPVPANLNQNQFVTSPNAASGNIYKDVNNTGTLTSTGDTWGSPIGLGTDPATGIVYGINAKALSKWTGSGNATSVGTVTGDVTWTTGTTLNDIAVDAGGNLYCIVFLGANTYLYRINPTALTAKLVVQATGTFITDGTTTNGNGLAYLGDVFYYSRINGSNTDIWKLNACGGGVSSFVGSVAGLNLGDLGSCATVTCVPADFSFNCLVPSGGLQEGNFKATGASQTNILRVPIMSTITGLANFTVAGAGITTSPAPYTLTLTQGATFADIPVVFDGSGASGPRTITVTANVATGSCAIIVTVDPCLAGTSAPTLSGTTANNVCPATTANLNSLVTSATPTGATLVWFINSTHTGTAYSTPTTATANTYYAFYYDAASDCYSPATGAVTAVIAGCCNAGSTAPTFKQ